MFIKDNFKYMLTTSGNPTNTSDIGNIMTQTGNDTDYLINSTDPNNEEIDKNPDEEIVAESAQQIDEEIDEEISINANEEIETNECPICLEYYNNCNMIVFICNHKICLECLQMLYWSRGKNKKILCPICRYSIEDAFNANKNPQSSSPIDEMEVTQRIRCYIKRRSCYFINCICFICICFSIGVSFYNT